MLIDELILSVEPSGATRVPSRSRRFEYIRGAASFDVKDDLLPNHTYRLRLPAHLRMSVPGSGLPRIVVGAGTEGTWLELPFMSLNELWIPPGPRQVLVQPDPRSEWVLRSIAPASGETHVFHLEPSEVKPRVHFQDYDRAVESRPGLRVLSTLGIVVGTAGAAIGTMLGTIWYGRAESLYPEYLSGATPALRVRTLGAELSDLDSGIRGFFITAGLAGALCITSIVGAASLSGAPPAPGPLPLPPAFTAASTGAGSSLYSFEEVTP